MFFYSVAFGNLSFSFSYFPLFFFLLLPILNLIHVIFQKEKYGNKAVVCQRINRVQFVLPAETIPLWQWKTADYRSNEALF